MRPRLLTITVLVLTAVASATYADRRPFAFTYTNSMIAPEATELEFYQTTRLRSPNANSWEYRFELEHGISERFDLSVYQIFLQTETEKLAWDAFQIRGRYRLATAGKVVGDPVLYLEYQRKLDLKLQNKFEGKLLTTFHSGNLIVAANPVYEFFWAPGDPIHEFGLDAAVGLELSYRFTLGAELLLRREMLKDVEDESKAYFGPGFSLATGGVFYTFGYVWGLTDDSDDARVRLLIGVGL